jgi:glutamate--cysteine ligase
MIKEAARQRAAEYFLEKFREIQSRRNLKGRGRRIGSELKFPLVNPDGTAAGSETTRALWDFLSSRGWSPLEDPHSGETIGATMQGELNEHRASCETGYCKVELSLAHSGDLLSLGRTVDGIKGLLREFSESTGAAFLGFGLQPVTPPSKTLLMKKSRNLFWDRIFGGNSHIPPGEGTDVHLFTINASNQVHIDVTVDEAVDAINVFNGIAGAQVALTANSNIWKGRVDPNYKCVGEMFWDWWLKDSHCTRYGVPERRFSSLEDYFFHILGFTPVYVRREGSPVGLPRCRSFLDFYACGDADGPPCESAAEGRACGVDAGGGQARVEGIEQDLDRHFTFFWHNARLSRYYTLENRINDQQPHQEMMAIPALTLGVMENLSDAVPFMEQYPWETLRQARVEAARNGLQGKVREIELRSISEEVVAIAEKGLKARGLGEEVFLAPLRERLEGDFCPADRAADIFRAEGPAGFVRRTRV